MKLDLDRTGSGKLIASVAVCAVWLLLFAASCGSIAPTVAPTEPVDSPRASDSDASPPETEVLFQGVGITFGRAALRPDERVTLFYVAKDMSGKYEGAAVIDSAEITDSDERSWSADEYGELLHQPPLTLAWVTFPVSDAAQGDLQVVVNSMQAGGSSVTGPLQLRQLAGLVAQSDASEAAVIDSGMCVSSEEVAFGFHEKACAREFVDPQTFRQKGTTPGAPRSTPRPTPTPEEYSGRPTLPLTPHSTESLDGVDQLLFTLCTPWLFSVFVVLDNIESPRLGFHAPSTGFRCVLP